MIPTAFAMKNKYSMEVGKKELTDKKKIFYFLNIVKAI
jgi:hypothetical protein